MVQWDEQGFAVEPGLGERLGRAEVALLPPASRAVAWARLELGAEEQDGAAGRRKRPATRGAKRDGAGGD
eukprot:4984415-Prymnesium_polylepis.4